MTAIDKFDQIVKEAMTARDILVALQKRLEEFTAEEVDEVNARRPEDYELLVEDIITANTVLEDWAENIYTYKQLENEFNREIGQYKPLGFIEWDEEGYYENDDGEEEKCFSYDQEVFVYLERDGKIQVEAFGDIDKFERGEYKQVRKFINKAFKDEGYDE